MTHVPCLLAHSSGILQCPRAIARREAPKARLTFVYTLDVGVTYSSSKWCQIIANEHIIQEHDFIEQIFAARIHTIDLKIIPDSKMAFSSK